MKRKSSSFKLLLLAGMALYCIMSVMFSYSFSQGPNNRNVSVDTTVNITNSLPVVYFVTIDGGATNITLNAGTYRNVTCNASIRDYNGGATITNVSATFFNNVSVVSTAADDNSTHYTVNCSVTNTDSYTANVTCVFPVLYYANNSNWICNVTATDPYQYTGVNRTASGFNKTNIDALFALNVTTLIDYGELAVGDLSTPQQANVTNLGNRNINISVRGYGNVSNDGLAMYCQFGNISIANEKFNTIGGVNLATYTNLSNSLQNISGLTVVKQTTLSQVINTTYWLLYVPPNPFGRCNGTVVFQAEYGG